MGSELKRRIERLEAPGKELNQAIEREFDALADKVRAGELTMAWAKMPRWRGLSWNGG